MNIIADTGPVIGLAKINCIHLLKHIATGVLIPPMVNKELMGKTGFESEHIEHALADFIKVNPLGPIRADVQVLLNDLGEGERQAIALASGLPGKTLLLLDDRAGRTAAAKLNIPCTGLIGLLLLAKEKYLIEEIGPLVEELKAQGYWLSDEIVLTAKRLAGEL